MAETTNGNISRRDFSRIATGFAAASALTAVNIPHVHAADDSTIRVALIGCGGRGTGAAGQALSVKAPVKLVAMADVFPNKLNGSFQSLKRQHGDQVEVSDDQKFLGFDAYKKAMDCLKKGDVAILTTPPAFRWPFFKYAIEKGLNVFMEKPVTVDGPSTKKMLALGEEAEKKNLKVGVGLMVRHCQGRRELFDRIRNGEIGDIVALRGYRMGGRAAATGRKPEGMSDLLYQIQRFHSFIWASGGVYSDYYIHQIDELSWMKDAWPVSAAALGGRHYRGEAVDQNLDTYSVEYTFPDGTKFFYYGRNMTGCHSEFASYVLGSKGSAIVSTNSHTPGRVRTYKGYKMDRDNMLWAFPQPEPNPYQLEWDHLIEAIREDKKYNEVQRGAMASVVTSMGRMAAHTGQIITLDQMLNCPHEMAPDADKFTDQSPAPIVADANGRYPVPEPGVKKEREY